MIRIKDKIRKPLVDSRLCYGGGFFTDMYWFKVYDAMSVIPVVKTLLRDRAEKDFRGVK